MHLWYFLLFFCFSFFCFSLLGEEREGKEKKKMENVTIVCMRVVGNVECKQGIKSLEPEKKRKRSDGKRNCFCWKGDK